MNTNMIKRQVRLTLALVTAVGLTQFAVAQEKGATRLLNLNAASPQSGVMVVQARMDCPKCQDSIVRVAQPSTKGSQPEVRLVGRHGCSACQSNIQTTGMGKQARNQVVHTCEMAQASAVSCCTTKATTSGSH